jgi:hypothetical protein
MTDPTLDMRLQQLKADIRRSHAELEAAIDRRYAELNAKINRKFRELETRMERTDLIRWGLLVMLANLVLTAGATALLNAHGG